MPNSHGHKILAAVEPSADRRAADRHKLVLRVGLIEQNGRSIFCLVRNISSNGVQVKAYGRVTPGVSASLSVGDEDPVPGTLVWSRDGLAGIAFEEPLNPQKLLRIGQKLLSARRRTGPRIATDLQGWMRTAGLRHPAQVCDLSMMGARVRTARSITFGETITIEMPGLPVVRAFIRWSDGAEHGLAFQTPLPMQIIAGLLSQETGEEHSSVSDRPAQTP